MNLTFNINVPLKDKKFYDHILKCLNYNSPITYSKINLDVLKNSGIDITLPIYVEHSPNKKLFKQLVDIKNFYNFCLVILCKGSELKLYRKFKNINNIYILVEREISKSLKENLYKININYQTPKLQENKEDEGFDFGDCNLKEHFEGYNLIQNYSNINFEINVNRTKYVFNSYRVDVRNKSKDTQKLSFKFAKLLNNEKLNYYKFLYKNKVIEAFNLLNEKQYFIYTSIKAKNIKFSLVDGLLNSNRACIIVYFEIVLKGNEQKTFFINESDDRDNVFEMYEKNIVSLKRILNVQISTNNKKLDNFFNFLLPKKIIINGMTNCKYEHLSINEALNLYNKGLISDYECYKHIKESFLIEKTDNIELISNNMNYSLKIFFENMSKNISVSHGEKAYLNIDDVLFYNTRIVSKSALKKANGDIEIVF